MVVVVMDGAHSQTAASSKGAACFACLVHAHKHPQPVLQATGQQVGPGTHMSSVLLSPPSDLPCLLYNRHIVHITCLASTGIKTIVLRPRHPAPQRNLASLPNSAPQPP